MINAQKNEQKAVKQKVQKESEPRGNPVVKQAQIKAIDWEGNNNNSYDTKVELSAGPFTTLGNHNHMPPEAGEEDKEPLDEIKYKEIANNSDHWLDQLDQAVEAEDSDLDSDGFKEPQLSELTYLMLKGESMGTTPCKLSTKSSFYLQGIAVSYKLSSQPAKDHLQCLDTLGKYQHMLLEISAILEAPPSKKSPLPINIFCSKPDSTPKLAPAKMVVKNPKAVKKQSTKATKHESKDSAKDDNSGSANWCILHDLCQEHTCAEHGNPCYVALDGSHYKLSPANLALWAVVVSWGKGYVKSATQPAAPAPAPVPAPALAPALFGNPAGLLAFMAEISAAAHPLAPAPAPVLPAVPVNTVPHAVMPDDWNAGQIEFPLIKDWLESIADLHPCFLTHVDVLTGSGLTHINHLVMPELTYTVLMEETNMNFVDSMLLLRKAKEVVCLWRADNR